MPTSKLPDTYVYEESVRRGSVEPSGRRARSVTGHLTEEVESRQTVEPERSVSVEQGEVPAGQSHPVPLNSVLVAFMYVSGIRLPQIVVTLFALS